jgi:hypothetical protein
MTGAGAKVFLAKISMSRSAQYRAQMVKPLQAPAQLLFSGPQLGTGSAYKRPSFGFHHHIRQPEMPPGNVGGLVHLGRTNFLLGHGTPPIAKINLWRANKFPGRANAMVCRRF